MNLQTLPLVLGTALVTSSATKKSLRHLLFVLALAATMSLCTAPADAFDLNISNPDPQYPVTPVNTVGWDPGMNHARAIHWVDRNAGTGQPADWYQFWASCPDDGGCSNIGVTDPQWQLSMDIGGNQGPCHPNSGDGVVLTQPFNFQYNSLPCPLYANWYGNWWYGGPRAWGAGINNYGWNRWNSPNLFIGLSENLWRSPSLWDRRLDNALLSFKLLAYLSRTYVDQNGRSPRGQGRITIGFTFFSARPSSVPFYARQLYIVEMNLSNMREHLTDHPITDDSPNGAATIPVSNPWRDDIWAEAITPNENTPPHEWVIGARNWGFNLIEGQQQTVFFDPWWVATTLLYPPGDCPKMVNNDGTPTTSYDDPAQYGFIPCGNRESFKLPYEVLFDENGQPGARLEGFYVGVEMAGTAVYGNAAIHDWKIQTRW